MKKKVLNIDDDLNVCREIKYALQNETTDAYYALSLSEGIEKLTKHQFCLVIMDILLSEADGIELLKMIRQIKPIPILYYPPNRIILPEFLHFGLERKVIWKSLMNWNNVWLTPNP